MQWNANGGYCGEVSLIVAGMARGQYTSQWTARALASSHADQRRYDSQALLGTEPPVGSVLTAASGMRMTTQAIDTTTQGTPWFLGWVKQHFLAGDTVIIGVFNNVNTLEEGGAGDAEYDHIVPVTHIGSTHPLAGADASRYYADDTITISDNGLYTPQDGVPGNTPDNPAGSTLYTSTFRAFQRSREQANRGSGAVGLYSLRNRPSNYAVAVTGLVDRSAGGPYLLPVQLTASSNSEGTQDQDQMAVAPAARPIRLTATVTLPDASRAYRLYRYDDFANVPTRDFNAAAGDAAQSWDIPAGSGRTFRVSVDAMSNQTVAFRAVPRAAP